MEDRFVLQDVSLQEAGVRLAQVIGENGLNEAGAQTVIGWIQELADEGDRVEVVRGQTSLRRRGRVPGTRVFIDVRKAAITTIALLVDAMKTRGLAIGTLVAMGYDPKCMALLSLTEGELCNVLSLEKLQKADFPVNSARLAMLTAKQRCPHREFNCRHMSEDMCGIDEAAVDRNIRVLAKTRSIELTADGAIQRLR